MELTEQQKAQIVECAEICEMRLRMATGPHCADESTNWRNVDRQIAARYSAEAFRIAQGREVIQHEE